MVCMYILSLKAATLENRVCKFAALPKGWIREKTKNGTPYYVEK